MKNVTKSEFAPERKSSSKNFRLPFLGLFFSLFLISCSKEELNISSQESQSGEISEINLSTKVASSSTTIQEIFFSAVAQISDCYGENIAFSGIIENRVSKTTDATGEVHYTRSFTTRGMTGVGTDTGTEFEVIGGAEMFAIKNPVFNAEGMLSIPGSLVESEIVIHQGTLVFKSTTDNSKIVARHIIRKVPGKEGWVNKWVCGGK